MNTITITTFSQLTKVCASLVETERLLNKELSFPLDLQKKDKIDFYTMHIKKLSTAIYNHSVTA